MQCRRHPASLAGKTQPYNRCIRARGKPHANIKHQDHIKPERQPKPKAAPLAERSLVCRIQDAFRVLARAASAVLGTAWAFVFAIAIIVIWALTGHLFNYSDTWQLIINTGTTIVTFLMVFLIQNTQNRDSKAVHLKLDELIRSAGGARNHLVDIERLSDEELQRLQKEFERIGQKPDQAKARAAEVKKEIRSR